MSVLSEYPGEAISNNKKDVQIWNNSAFKKTVFKNQFFSIRFFSPVSYSLRNSYPTFASMDLLSNIQDNRSRTDKEKEELDRAIALSLAEGLKDPNGYQWQPDNNEDLAKSRQDDFPPSYPPYVPSECHPIEYRICGGCSRDIGYNNYLGCMGTFFHPECFRCCACGYPITEHESVNVQYISLGDGRSLCLECMQSAIMDTGDCQPLYHAIRDYYEEMNMRLDQQIPMLLVERHAINEAIVGEKNGFHHLRETRGLCLSEEQTVAGILRRPKIGGHRLVGLRTQHQKLTRICEVNAILVLYGLARLLTGAILGSRIDAWLVTP